ncbi:MAG: hypothetical protein DMG68_11755 [Acidobacteria bacterium]|jgi:hypothetical protein|nr:MAG: hypothetical protein DMG68_11755 [Acidobacteriota bacterium]
MLWIKIAGDINAAYKPLLVASSEDASRLTAPDAEQVTRSAAGEYPNYRWRPVRIMGLEYYIVEGEQK